MAFVAEQAGRRGRAPPRAVARAVAGPRRDGGVRLARMIRSVRPDVVHTHTAKAGAVGRARRAARGRTRPVVVHTFHGHVLRGYFGIGWDARLPRHRDALARHHRPADRRQPGGAGRARARSGVAPRGSSPSSASGSSSSRASASTATPPRSGAGTASRREVRRRLVRPDDRREADGRPPRRCSPACASAASTRCSSSSATATTASASSSARTTSGSRAPASSSATRRTSRRWYRRSATPSSSRPRTRERR